MFTVKKTHENDHVLLRSALRIGLGRPPGGGGGGCRCFSGFIYLVKSRFWRRQNSVVNYLYCSATLDLCSFAFLLARADPFFFFAGICIVYARTHTRTTVQISVQANGAAYDDPEWRLRRGDSPLRHRRRGGHQMHTSTHHTRTLTPCRPCRTVTGQSHHKRNRHRRTPTPLPRLFRALWLANTWRKVAPSETDVL